MFYSSIFLKTNFSNNYWQLPVNLFILAKNNDQNPMTNLISNFVIHSHFTENSYTKYSNDYAAKILITGFLRQCLRVTKQLVFVLIKPANSVCFQKLEYYTVNKIHRLIQLWSVFAYAKIWVLFSIFSLWQFCEATISQRTGNFSPYVILLLAFNDLYSRQKKIVLIIIEKQLIERFPNTLL